jgi:hypothetical protein
MLTLRGDYEKLHGDGGKGLKQLEQLEQLRETKDPAGLYKSVQECEHESLKRLLTTPAGEIGKALSGAYSQSTVNGIINIRHALDKRVESYVYGDKEPCACASCVHWCKSEESRQRRPQPTSPPSKDGTRESTASNSAPGSSWSGYRRCSKGSGASSERRRAPFDAA